MFYCQQQSATITHYWSQSLRKGTGKPIYVIANCIFYFVRLLHGCWYHSIYITCKLHKLDFRLEIWIVFFRSLLKFFSMNSTSEIGYYITPLNFSLLQMHLNSISNISFPLHIFSYCLLTKILQSVCISTSTFNNEKKKKEKILITNKFISSIKTNFKTKFNHQFHNLRIL